jgi:hypothetical protein
MNSTAPSTPCFCIECSSRHCAATATCEYECCNGHDSLDELVKVKPVSHREVSDLIHAGVRSILGVK